MIEEVSTLEARLNHFDLNTRTQALQALLEHQPPISTLQSPNLDLANMHCHIFFSFNGYGHSPTSLAWLDGMSAGEQAITELLDLLINKGVVAFNIIPDRNWNIADPALKQLKLQKLYEVVELAQKLDLPLNIGTEMNSYGQKLVDDFDAPELAPVRDAFIDGAYFIYGHTVAQRYLGKGYQSDWAKTHFPTRRERNAFYSELGRRVEPGPVKITTLEELIGAVSNG